MSDLPNPSNNFVATLDYDLSLSNLNSIFGGMWSALQPYRDVVAESDAAIDALNARTLTVIGEAITPELDLARAAVVQAQEDVADLVAQSNLAFAALFSAAEAELAALLGEDLSGLADVEAARSNLGLAAVAATGSYDDLSDVPLIGIGANNLVQLDGSGALPPVSGANLTGVPSGMSIAAVTTVSAGVSSFDVMLPAGTGPLFIEGRDLVCSANGKITMRTSTDGVNFASGASDYTNSGSNSASIEFDGDNGSLRSFFFVMRGARSAGSCPLVFGHAVNATLDVPVEFVGSRRALGAITHLRFSSTAGTFTSGSVVVSQIKGG